jgi:hypothetical protein
MKNLIFLSMILVVSCNNIQSGSNLSASEHSRIDKLFRLEENETIINFYSEFKSSVTGNFYTEIRVATYWIDENNDSKNQVNNAFYTEITKIDTVTNVGLTYSPYLLITKENGSSFKVCFDGEKSDLKRIFTDVLNRWEKAGN